MVKLHKEDSNKIAQKSSTYSERMKNDQQILPTPDAAKTDKNFYGIYQDDRKGQQNQKPATQQTNKTSETESSNDHPQQSNQYQPDAVEPVQQPIKRNHSYSYSYNKRSMNCLRRK